MTLSEGAAKLFDKIKRNGNDYKLACNSPAMQRMLIDLAGYCRAHETCVVLDKDGKVDNERSLILEGRREVWLWLENHLKLSSQKLFLLYTGQEFNPGDTDD